MGILKVTHSYSVLTVGASQIDKCSQLQRKILYTEILEIPNSPSTALQTFESMIGVS